MANRSRPTVNDVPQPPRRASWALCACLLLACSGAEPERAPRAPEEAAELAPPSDEELQTLPLPELRKRLSSLRARALEHEATERGVRMARGAADVAAALLARGDSPELLSTAREMLQLAAKRKRLDGACQAELALSALESGAAADPSAGYLAAYRAARRFASLPTQARCVAEAERIMQALSEHRPEAAVLLAVDADPDLDDPSVAFPAAQPETTAPVDEVDAADWVRTQAGDLPPEAVLERIDVYGAPRGQRAAVRSEVRVVLQLQGMAVYRRGEQPAQGALPRRLFLDLDGTRMSSAVAAMTRVDAAGLRRVRVLALSDAHTRVSFDVEETTAYRLFFLTDPYRVVMDFRSTPPRKRTGGLQTIVLDPVFP